MLELKTKVVPYYGGIAFLSDHLMICGSTRPPIYT